MGSYCAQRHTFLSLVFAHVCLGITRWQPLLLEVPHLATLTCCLQMLSFLSFTQMETALYAHWCTPVISAPETDGLKVQAPPGLLEVLSDNSEGLELKLREVPCVQPQHHRKIRTAGRAFLARVLLSTFGQSLLSFLPMAQSLHALWVSQLCDGSALSRCLEEPPLFQSFSLQHLPGLPVPPLWCTLSLTFE